MTTAVRMKSTGHAVAISVLVLTLTGCGVPDERHAQVLKELEESKAQNAAAAKQIRDLEEEVERLSRTDAGNWSRILELKARNQWPQVIEEVDAFLLSWSGSPNRKAAEELRSEAVDLQATGLLARARSEIQEQKFDQARATLQQIASEYPNSRARAAADNEIRTLATKIADARRRQIGNGSWRSSSEISPVDDSTNVFLVLDATGTIKGKFGDSTQPQLHVRCKERKTEIYVVWGVYLGLGETDVLHRLDDTPARTLEWTLSTDNEATFFPGNDQAFARELQKHEKLLLRVTPYGESPVTATFMLAGLENAIDPLKSACQWN